MRRTTIVLAAGLGLGVLGAVLVLGYVRGVEARATAGQELVPVFVAERSIPAGTPGTGLPPMVRRSEMPRRYAPPGAVGNLDSIAGQFAVEEIEAGSPLTSSAFASAGRTAGELAIPGGKEAVVVSTSVAAGLANYLEPGDRVSVYATFRGPRNLTRKILSGVEVLATTANESETVERLAGASVVPGDLVTVLAVTPREAARLVFASEIGNVWLTLVPQGQRSPKVGDYTISLQPALTRSAA